MYRDITANKRRTVLIMGVFVAFVALIDWLTSLYLGGGRGVFVGVLIGTLVYTLITYYSGSRMALAVNGAREIQKQENPRLWNIVENLAITDGLPMPRVFIIDDPAPNAFATGRDPKHSAVCATTGILNMMTDTELQGVFAHELGHVKNYDIRVSMVAFALSAVISLIANIAFQASWNRDNEEGGSPFAMAIGFLALILAPLAASLIQLAVSRQREYLADATGALTTRYPDGLADALEKIAQGGSTLRRQNQATAHLFFANPLKDGSMNSLFSTHPPIEQRIARLRAMDAGH